MRHATRDKTSWHCSHYCSANADHPDSPPTGEGSGTSTCPPDLLVCTPALRPGGPGPTRAITIARTLQDGRRNLHRTKNEIQDDSNARRLPTLYFLQYPTTVPPRFKGKRRLPCPHSCTPPLLITIKGGGGLPLAGAGLSGLVGLSLSGFSLPRGRSGITEHSSQPTPLLAETWELPSLSRLACIPYYKHSGCKII